MPLILDTKQISKIFKSRVECIKNPEVKSIFWGNRENFMELDAPKIYALDNYYYEVPTQLIHYCSNTDTDAKKMIGRMLAPAAMINRYYQNSMIAEIYDSEKGNICGFDTSTLDTRSGPSGVAPGYLFQ